MNIDKPTQTHAFETAGSGDNELIGELRKYYSFCANPTGIKCRTADDKTPYTMAADLDLLCTLETGLQCLNDRQGGYTCSDYEVSFNCDCGRKYLKCSITS